MFGKPIRQRRPRYEPALERADRRTLADRAERVRWLEKVIPRNRIFGMPFETACVFEEAKASFVYGSFVAAVILAASFVEHWFVASLGARGYEQEASQGLAASIKFARANALVDPLGLNKADQLRLIRNPFVHLKPFDHPHTIVQRSARQNTHPAALLESDSKDALIAMYGVAA